MPLVLGTACTTSAAPSLDGVWRADQGMLASAIVRPGYLDPEGPQVVARGLSFATQGEVLRWCLRDVEDDETGDPAATPCVCGATSNHCARGVVELSDGLAVGAVGDVRLRFDDARTDLVGTLTIVRGPDHDLLGLNVVRSTDDPLRRPTAAEGLAGPHWAGADGLTWYRRVATTP